VTALGISVNATLVFSLERYSAVMDAYLTGLEQARSSGHDPSQIHSVASFPITWVEAEIDRRLLAIGSPAALALMGQSGIACAALAYQAYEQTFAGERWIVLAGAGAHIQRPLWLSTGGESSAHDETHYLAGIIAPGTIQAASEEVIATLVDHGVISASTMIGGYSVAAEVFGDLDAIGIDLGDVFAMLESESLISLERAWLELLDCVRRQLAPEPR